jgi:DNA-binding CsgD family transcriptional regulator
LKITNEQSREIYTLASDPAKKMTNREIGAKFGISESSVRHHVRKWEKQVKTISKNNAKAAAAIAGHIVNIVEEASLIMSVVKSGIQQAKSRGVSPEKMSPLYNNWIKTLELIGNMQIIKRIEALKARKP